LNRILTAGSDHGPIFSQINILTRIVAKWSRDRFATVGVKGLINVVISVKGVLTKFQFLYFLLATQPANTCSKSENNARA